jgi:hypothetical protein
LFDDDDSDGEVIQDDSAPTRERARRNSKIPNGTTPKPTTLKYYSKAWQSMLIAAKNNMRRHVALVHAFPERDNHLNEANNILIKTIAEYKEQYPLDDSKFSSSIPMLLQTLRRFT